MPHWRIIYYLLQFYLFVTSGALGYLSLRAWLDPALSRRKREDPHRVPRWSHFVRGLGFVAIAVAAIIGALKEGAAGISLSAIALLRFGGYALLIGAIPVSLRREKLVWLGAGFILLGEALLVGHSPGAPGPGGSPTGNATIAYAALLLTDVGIGIIGLRLSATVLRIRLVDRLVISYAVFSLLIAQLVAFLILGLLSSFGVDLPQVLAMAEKPMLTTITSVLITAALVGFFMARDLSSPVTKLGKALRAIGEGNLGHRVDLGRAARDGDEMSELAQEVNRLAGQLKAAEDLRADFFSFVSHELKSPLTSIQGFVTTLESVDDFTADERAEMYGIIHDETARLLRMINELLDISRVQAGKPLKLNLDWVDAGRHLVKVAGIFRPDSQRHRIELVTPADPVWIYADADKLDQIIINLTSNAIKYSPHGGVVTLKLVYSAESVLISVADQGVGMTSDQCAHVFDKFYRVAEQDGESAKRLRRVDGAGIGLYLTRALVEAHKGSITVASEPGEGSVFTVTLPTEALAVDGAGRSEATRKIRVLQSSGRGLLLSESERRQVPHLLVERGAGEANEPAARR